MRALIATMVACLAATEASAQISKKEYPPQPDLVPASADDVLPPDFRGQITYTGMYRGKTFVPGPAMREISVGEFLRSAANAKTLAMAGEYVLTMEFSGRTVRGSLDARSGVRGRDTVELDARTFMGTRDGAVCRLNWNDGTDTTAYCGRGELRVNANSTTPNGRAFGYAALAPATKLVDYVERDRLAAIEAEKRKAEAARLAEIRARNDKIVNGAAPIAQRLDALAEIDSRAWVMSGYRPGSMTDVKKAKVTDAKNFYVTGQFQYADGRSGALTARVRNGMFSCVQFSDEASCRAVGHPESMDRATNVAGAVLGSMFAGPSAGGRKSPSAEMQEDREYERAIQHQVNCPGNGGNDC